jgi:hypothetical protein
MITIGISKWPTEKGPEVGKKSLEAKPLPNFIEMIGPYMYPDENEGIVCIAIFKYDKAKAGEAAEAIANNLMIYNTIPGFRYSMRLASGATATMKMMGFE